jgi:hypothetical protein
MSIYRENERVKAEACIKKGDLFYGEKGGGKFGNVSYDFVLINGKNNLFKPIQNDAIAYFDKNKIAWWHGTEPTGHTLSSQAACLNHLFSLRNDKQAVLSLLSTVSTEFTDVLKIETDKYLSGYIQFEAVSDRNLLNEGEPTRGTNCTSIDALIYAVDKYEKKWIIPIEWKYTEEYDNQDKSSGNSGTIRKGRYNGLIEKSKQLKSENIDWYYFEPFYQLMRQTLWAEQMVANKAAETIKADDYMHLHIIPKENTDLLKKIYPCSNLDMEKTWRGCLENQDKYKIIAPSELLKNLSEDYAELKKYLSERYWN